MSRVERKRGGSDDEVVVEVELVGGFGVVEEAVEVVESFEAIV